LAVYKDFSQPQTGDCGGGDTPPLQPFLDEETETMHNVDDGRGTQDNSRLRQIDFALRL
jgi:hypothetical protein